MKSTGDNFSPRSANKKLSRACFEVTLGVDCSACNSVHCRHFLGCVFTFFGEGEREEGNLLQAWIGQL